MEIKFLTLSDFTPTMLIIGLIVLIVQLILCFKTKRSPLNSLPLCILIIVLILSSISPVWGIGSEGFQKVMADLMYYFCISSIGDIVAWIIYYTYCLIKSNYKSSKN